MLTEGLCFCCSKYIDNSSDSEQEEEEGRKAHGKGYYEEQAEIKERYVNSTENIMHNSSRLL